MSIQHACKKQRVVPWCSITQAQAKRTYALETSEQRLQGVIVAAPVYAATGSRWKAMGIATASVSPAIQVLMFSLQCGMQRHNSLRDIATSI